MTKLKHSSQPGEAGSFTRGGIGYGVRHDKLVFRAGCAKMLRGRHMQDLVSENRPCPGFPQQKSALSTRFPQNLWIKLGKSGKVPKIGVKCRAGRSQSAALMLMCSVSDRTRSDRDGPALSWRILRVFSADAPIAATIDGASDLIAGPSLAPPGSVLLIVQRPDIRRSKDHSRVGLDRTGAPATGWPENPPPIRPNLPMHPHPPTATASQSWCCRAFHGLTDPRPAGIVPRLRLYSLSEARLQ